MKTEDVLPTQPQPPLPPAERPGHRLNTWVIILIIVSGLAVLLIPVLAIVAQAKERALRIQCVNNLKNIGLGVRASGENRTNGYPKSLAELRLQITNPKVLICPSQLKGVTMDNFELAKAASTYVYDGEGASEAEPNRIILLCPHHRNALVADGSIQQLSLRRFETIEVRNGHKYLK